MGRSIDTLKPKGTTSWCQVEKFQKFLPPNILKMHSLDLSVLRFPFKIFCKLLKFRLWNYSSCGWFLENSYNQQKNLYGYKLVRKLPSNLSWKDTASGTEVSYESV